MADAQIRFSKVTVFISCIDNQATSTAKHHHAEAEPLMKKPEAAQTLRAATVCVNSLAVFKMATAAHVLPAMLNKKVDTGLNKCLVNQNNPDML